MKKIFSNVKSNIICVVSAVWLLGLTAVYPFYMENGYDRIGEAKFHFFFGWILSGTVLMLLAFFIDRILKRDGSKEKLMPEQKCETDPKMKKPKGERVKREDAMVIRGVTLFGATSVLSFCFSSFRGSAFWGFDGWNMGLFSQLSFLLILLFARTFSRDLRKLMWVSMIASGTVVFFLGILNRFQVYPIHLSGEGSLYLSTLGNINWYSGFWAILYPVMAYWFIRVKKDTGMFWLSGIAILIATVTGITQGSNCAWIVFGVTYYVLLRSAFKAEDEKPLLRWIILAGIFPVSMIACRVIGILCHENITYESEFLKALTRMDMIWLPGLIGIALIAGAYMACYYFRPSAKVRGGFLVGADSACLVSALMFVVLILCNTAAGNHLWPVGGISWFYFGDGWGNARGIIWKDTIRSMRGMGIRSLLLGVGPDCYAYHMYSIPAISEHMGLWFGNAILTCAHCEMLTMLINEGILGLIGYVWIFAAAWMCLGKRQEEEGTAAQAQLIRLCILSYLCHNLFSFQQIISTPVIFLLIGAGMSLCKSGDIYE